MERERISEVTVSSEDGIKAHLFTLLFSLGGRRRWPRLRINMSFALK